MFDITKEDIQKLSDKDLRELVGKLCEAELRKQNIPTVFVTYGGYQDAADGGIDVRIRINNTYQINGFVPCNCVGFQVKVPRMDASAIKSEMLPKGILRDSIRELANESGSYIIVSSHDDASDTMLTSRKDAMKEAIKDCPDAKSLKLDFYDSQRLATWVNEHASMIQWVHGKIGTSLFGWKPFSTWSDSKGNIDDEYLINGVKLINVGCKGAYNELSAVEGINQIRHSLNTHGISVRIVGLSGVGKTRLAQALCDNRIGNHAINTDCIVYTDLSHSPEPSPEVMAEILSVRIERTVLIVDNCAPDLHRILSDICKKGNGNVSLLTIEYDIQTDQAEEVDVYKLEPSSSELIEQILQLRYKNLDNISIQRIAEFSGGNARIALALAGALKAGDDISTFSDDQLFKRLFWQGKSADDELLDAAKACSLVYSFSIEESENELGILAQLGNMTISKFYKHSQELLKRGLMQRRGKWRAILPHALANWLADRALKEFPVNHIRKIIEESGEKRLLSSLSRRLGFLHNNETANKITAKWLSDDGLLNNITSLNGTGVNIFMNIAPVNIERTLLVIEAIELRDNAQEFFSKNNPHYQTFMDILYAIAYESQYFERCLKLLISFALSEKKDQNHPTIRNKVKGLFQVCLSGTHAPAELRLSVIDRLIKKGGDVADLGFDFLKSALEAFHLAAFFPRNFGSRNRDTGYRPANNKEIKAWYACFITYMQGLLHDDNTEKKAKELLANKLQDLLYVGMIEEINSFADIALELGEWGAGWVSLKHVLYIDHKKIPEDLSFKLKRLQEKLVPKSVYENARASLLQSSNQFSYYRKEKEEATRLKQLAYRIIKDTDAVNRLIPELLCSTNPGIWPFAAALAEKCSNPKRIWAKFIEQYSLKEKSKCYPYQLLGGFLWGLNSVKPELVEEFLEEAVENELSYVFPHIQTSVPITKKGAKRIIRSIKFGTAPKNYYVCLSGGRAHETIDDEDLCEIIRLLATDNEGIKTSIEIYSMRIFEKTIDNISKMILGLGFELLSKYNFVNNTRNNNVSYEVSQIAELCFTSDDLKAMRMLCEKLREEILGDNMSGYYCAEILTTIAKVQPLLFLDTFLDFTDKVPSRIEQVLNSYHEQPVLNAIEDNVLQTWCEIKPETRYMLIGSVIDPCKKVGEEFVWKQIALSIIKNVKNPCMAIDLLMSNCLYGISWGKYSDFCQTKIEILEDLCEYVDKKMHEYIKQKITEIQRQCRAQLEKEKPDNEYGFE